MLFALEGMAFFDANADESRARLEVEFVNLSFSDKKTQFRNKGIAVFVFLWYNYSVRR